MYKVLPANLLSSWRKSPSSGRSTTRTPLGFSLAPFPTTYELQDLLKLGARLGAKLLMRVPSRSKTTVKRPFISSVCSAPQMAFRSQSWKRKLHVTLWNQCSHLPDALNSIKIDCSFEIKDVSDYADQSSMVHWSHHSDRQVNCSLEDCESVPELRASNIEQIVQIEGKYGYLWGQKRRLGTATGLLSLDLLFCVFAFRFFHILSHLDLSSHTYITSS